MGLLRDTTVEGRVSQTQAATDSTHLTRKGEVDAALAGKADAAGNYTVNQDLAAPADTGPLTSILSWLAGRLKAITGKTDWKTAPATTLEAAATHAASTANPHSVTKGQVGLTDVTNDAQLKIASNLGDLGDATTARANLGLGDSATKNTGSSSGTVAAGDDSRLSDTRTPTAHAASHKTGGGDAVKLNELALPTASVPFNGQKATNVGSGTAGTDGANIDNVNGAIRALTTKTACRVATTANVALSGEQTIDGISVVTGDRVLVKNQSTASQNGIYVAAIGSWSRAVDADASAEVLPGLTVAVALGTANGGQEFILVTAGPITLGTTSLTFQSQTVANDAVTDAKIGNRTVDDDLAAPADSGTLTSILSWLAGRLKAITGKTDWKTAPATTLEAAAAHAASTSNPHTVTKSQVGLSAVTNDAQLKIASNLSDLASAPTARTNLGLGAAALAATLDAVPAPTASVSLNNQRITDLADPTGDADGVNRQTVHRGSWKDACRAATTANVALSGEQTIDGISVVAGDRVLVKNQSTASQNGIYVASGGAWTRSVDANTSAKVTPGMTVPVSSGTVNGKQTFRVTNPSAITLGSTNISFEQISGAAQIVTSAGLTLVGNTLSTLLQSGFVLWVHKSGNDGTAERGRFDLPFLTLAAAKTDALFGDTIVVMPGTYDEHLLAKNGVNWLFLPGARVEYNGGTAGGIFDTSGLGSCLFQVRGHGSFHHAGGGSNGHVIRLNNAGDVVVFEAHELSSSNADCVMNFGTLRLDVDRRVEATGGAALHSSGIRSEYRVREVISNSTFAVSSSNGTLELDARSIVSTAGNAIRYTGPGPATIRAHEIRSTVDHAVDYRNAYGDLLTIIADRIEATAAGKNPIWHNAGTEGVRLHGGVALIGPAAGNSIDSATVSTTIKIYGAAVANVAVNGTNVATQVGTLTVDVNVE